MDVIDFYNKNIDEFFAFKHCELLHSVGQVDSVDAVLKWLKTSARNMPEVMIGVSEFNTRLQKMPDLKADNKIGKDIGEILWDKIETWSHGANWTGVARLP